MKPKYVTLLIVSVIILLLDQSTKIYINCTMNLHSSIMVVKNFFDITYLRNKGAAFSILANFSHRLPFFIIISLIAVVIILVMIRKLGSDQKLDTIALSLLLAGAIGNLIDRIRLGEVIDFISIHWYEHYWPAFNIADSAICVGVFLLAIDMFQEERRQKASQR